FGRSVGGWGLFPLAPLCDDAKSQLPSLLERMAKRLKNEIADPQKIALLWQTTAILSDMRYNQEFILPLMRKVMTMVKLEDFPSYSVGMAKGRRETITILGEQRFGPPDAKTRQTLESI